VRVSDADLRDLERRFRETSSVEDEAAWLLERVRLGDLPNERLELAAFLGGVAALELTDRRGPRKPVRAWAETLLRWGREAGVRAVLQPTHAFLANWEEESGLDCPPEVERVLVAAENWTLNPGEARRKRAARVSGKLSNRIHKAIRTGSFVTRSSHSLGLAQQALVSCVDVLGAGTADQVEAHLRRAMRTLYWGESEGLGLFAKVSVDALLRQELVPWALGYRDPVRERVEARQRAEGSHP